MFRQEIYRIWTKIFKTNLIFYFPVLIVITIDYEKAHKLQEVNRREGKVKVKCTLVQALRLCTGGTAHRGSRGIAVLYRH